MKNILITDSLFIGAEHEQKLREAGFELARLDNPKASEDELIEALKDKHGYILGGIEQVTDKVIESTNVLEAICFTGSDWRHFIPGHELATQKGIAITNCAGANATAVAEYTLSLILAMTREIFDLGRTGKTTFKSTNSLQGATVGIIGMGHIGEKVARMLKTFGVKEILYYSRTRKTELEKELGINYTEIEDLLKASDVVTLHVSKEAGANYIGKKYLEAMKDGSLIVNCSFETAIDFEALYQELKSGRIRCAHDGAVTDEQFQALPLNTWFNSNEHTAYNTTVANKIASDMAVNSIINLLNGREDSFVVNK